MFILEYNAGVFSAVVTRGTIPGWTPASAFCLWKREVEVFILDILLQHIDGY